jgi:hypothetical protein
MSPNRRRFTDSAVKALQPGAVVHDAIVTGLHVKASAQRKGFYLLCRTKFGQQRRPKLGDVGVLTIANARALARDMLWGVAKSKDPMGERLKLRADAQARESETQNLTQPAPTSRATGCGCRARGVWLLGLSRFRERQREVCHDQAPAVAVRAGSESALALDMHDRPRPDRLGHTVR